MSASECAKEKSTAKSDALLNNNFFIKRISGKFIVSSVVAMIFLYASSLIDTLIVGSFLGEDGLSAMSLIGPVSLVYYTVGATIGIGASIAASRVLGNDNPDDYKRVFTGATVMMAIATVIMTVAGYAFLDPISTALAGNSGEKYRELVKSYLVFYIPGGGFNLMSYIPMYFLKVEGRPKLSSRLFTLSAVINVLLSWLFMSPICDFGIGGASVATTVSLFVSAVLGFFFLLRNKSTIGFVRRSMSFANVKNIVVSGIPNGVTNLLKSARILLVNMLLISIGQTVLLPCYTVVHNVSDLMGSIMIGISTALLPLMGVYFSEQDYESERVVLRLSRRIGVIAMVPLTVLICAFPSVFFRLFNVTDPAILEAGKIALPIIGLNLIASYLNTMYTGYLTVIKRETLATVLVALRLIVVLAVFAFPLSGILGANGIWVSLTAAEIGTLLIYCLIRIIIGKKKPELDIYLLNKDTKDNVDVNFSVKNDVADITDASEKISEFCENSDVDMKLAMRVGLAIEEILTFLLSHCLANNPDSYVDVRVCKVSEGLMVRFRYIGEIFDPITYYTQNSDNEEMKDELLGIHLITKAARHTSFRQTLGANNLMIIF